MFSFLKINLLICQILSIGLEENVLCTYQLHVFSGFYGRFGNQFQVIHLIIYLTYIYHVMFNSSLQTLLNDLCIEILRRETNVRYPLVSPTFQGGQILLNLVAIRLAQTFHFERQRASSMLKTTLTLSYSTCLFHVLFRLPFFL